MFSIFTLLIAIAMTMTFFGKSIVGIGMGVVVLASIVMIFQKRQFLITRGALYKLFGVRETIAIMVMILVWIISASQGIKPDKSIKEVLEYFGIIFGGYIIFSAVQTHVFDFKKLFRWCVIGGTFCASILVLTPVLGEMALTWSSSYGSVLTFFIPMAFYLVVTSDNKKYIWWGCLVIMIAAIFASGGRTAWVALIALVIVMPFIMPIKNRALKFTILIVLTSGGAYAGLQSYKHTVGENIYQLRTQAMQNMDRPASGRLTVWGNTIDKITERPLLGYGIKSAQYLEISKGGDDMVIHVHNVILEMILETGLIGFIGFTLVILIFIWGFIRAYFRSDNVILKQQAMTVFLTCVSYGICSMALTSMFHAWWFLYLVVFLILLKTAELRLRA